MNRARRRAASKGTNYLITFHIRARRPGHPVISGILTDEPRVIGRSPLADVVLPEDSVSRRHARLFVLDDMVHIEDLNSANGLYVNGLKVLRAKITPTDRIRMGSYTLQVEPEADLANTAASHRTVLPFEDVGRLHADVVDKDHSSLSFLYRLSQRMAPHRSLNPLLETVLEELMENLPAERGYILTQSEVEDIAKVCVAKSRGSCDAAPPLSETLVKYVQRTRSSVLTSDAGDDERFEDAASIVAHQIQAAICVPLTSHETVFGVIYFDASSSPMPFTQAHLQLLSIVGQVAGTAVENILLTEKQIHQERLAAIGQTVSATSHDMRNILVGISGGTELLEMAQEKQSWERAAKATGIVRASLRRFEELVSSLLTCANKTELSLESTQLGPLLTEVVESMGHTAEKQGIRIVVDDTLTQAIALDTSQIHRVLTNLIRNAIDAMRETGGTIHIQTGTEEGNCVVRIRDSGPGIHPDHLPRLGQAFFTTKAGSGTGLGLAVCYRIMEQHHGRIVVESTPDAGTTFSLYFPEICRTTARHSRMTA